MKFIYLRSRDNRSAKGFDSPACHIPTYRIIRVLKGEGTYAFPDSELEIKAGDIFLTKPGIRSIDLSKSNDVHLQIVNFSGADYWLDEPYLLFQDEGRLKSFLNEIIEDMVFGKEDRRSALLNIAIDLFVKRKPVN